MANKKMMITASMLFFVHSAVFSAQNEVIPFKSVAEENKRYQDLVVKFKANELTEEDNTPLIFIFYVSKKLF